MTPNEYYFVPISVDSLEWTSHWLRDQRCDLLGAFLATQDLVIPRVRIVAIESKTAAESDILTLSPTVEPFRKALSQIVATLDALEEVLCQDVGTSLMADLKLSALIEHLTSEVLARISPIHAGEKHKIEILRTLTQLSKRQLLCDESLTLEGLVVVTQTELTIAPSEITLSAGRHPWGVKMVRCGVPTLRQLFEAEGLSGIAAQFGEAPHTQVSGSQSLTTAIVEEPLEGSSPIPNSTDIGQMNEDQRERLLQLEVACRSRNFKIGPLEDAVVFEGPTLISASVALAPGESIRPIQNASPDIARELGVHSVTVENDPGRPYYVRFLVPRLKRAFPPIPTATLPLVDEEKQQYLCLWLGAQVDGEPFRSAVSEWPHVLIAGTTGSGKTTFIRSLLTQLNRFNDRDVHLSIVDGKGEFDYIDIVRPGLFVPEFPEVMLGHSHATEVLEWLVEKEIPRRREVLTAFFRKNPAAPRSPKAAFIQELTRQRPFPIRPIVIVIDEFAEIMAASGPAAERFSQLVQRTVQGGRSALVHLMLSTQRPDANVIRGAIKANLPTRVALQVPSHHDSMTVLNSTGAEELLGMGDLIFEGSTGARVRLQGYSS